MTSRKRAGHQSDPSEQEVRAQEVLRANKELAAYFKGRRTEREARAALKIIKAFIRDRERIDPADRRPLSGAESLKGTTITGTRDTSDKKHRRRGEREVHDKTSKSPSAADANVEHDPTPSTKE